jgi:hypothetical protein
VDDMQHFAIFARIIRNCLFSEVIKRIVRLGSRIVFTMTGMIEKHRKVIALTASLLVAGTFAFSPALLPALAIQLGGGLNSSSKGWTENFTPAGIDSKLAIKFKGKLIDSDGSAVKNRFPFTPVGAVQGAQHTITIAARTDSLLSSKAISTRNMITSIEPGLTQAVNLNKSDFRLTSARGWKDFKLPGSGGLAVKTPVTNISAAAGNYRLDGNEAVKKSRFKTDVKLDTARQAAPSPRGNAAAGDYKVGLESSFSLSRRVDLTAGVTYNTERNRVAPRADDRKDSEAVYVGTKIRF